MVRAKGDPSLRYVLFEPSMSDQTMDRIDMENDLRRAIERGELRVHYQPLIDLTTDRIVGFEALVRWQHPVRGLVPPLSFIPLAEETGLIIPLGRWVLETACRQAMRWRDARPKGPPLMMSVNLSARQFVQPDLVDQVEAILTETGLDPSTLELEITESVVMDQSEVGIRSLHRLRDMGVRLVLDDFGTGYSSLAYLKHLPLDTIKIDRTFVAGLDGEADRSIVEAVIALAHGLRISVVAEGIETEGQFEILRIMGCDIGQGYLFARPLPEAEAVKLLAPGRSSASTRATAAVIGGATKPARCSARLRAGRARLRAERGAASGGARPS
jgi:EAL domain-containing protein (putative c-di-GMP-specific phosphodiesterase class I)